MQALHRPIVRAVAIAFICAAVPGHAQLVINEIDYDQPGDDFAEFLEIKNVSGAAVDLSLYEVILVNGSNGAVYQTVNLPSSFLSAGDYYVLCEDASTVANCDLDVLNSIQNGTDAVAITQGPTVIDTVSYEGDSVVPYTEGSGSGLVDIGASGFEFSGIARFPDGVDTDQNNVDLSVRCITPGTQNLADNTACTGSPLVEIHAIQGSGLVSPLAGQVVSTNDNIVTAVTDDGFFMQTPDTRSDGDVETSQGLFVFTNVPPLVSVGDQVDVIGEVAEFFDLTEITNNPLVTIDTGGNPLPAPMQFDASTPSPNQPQPANEVERYENMRVTATGVATGGTDRFGDTPVVASGIRTFRAPGIAFPGQPGLPVWDGNPEIFEIDTDEAGLTEVPMFGGQGYTATGPLGYSFGDYHMAPTSFSADPVPTLPRLVRAGEPSEVVIAALNVLRLFDTVDDPLTQDAVTDPADYATRLEKFSFMARVTLGAPDIIALQEVENLGVAQAMADRIAQDDPGLAYSPHLIEGNDVSGIDTAYLTRDDTIFVNSVYQHGANEIFTFDGSLLNDRPPLVLEADYLTGGTPFALTVINVHQRSLGGIDGADAVRVRAKRNAQAISLAILIQNLQTADPDINLIAIGDFNAFEFTDGYVDVMGQVTGAPDPLGAETPVTSIVSPPLSNQVLSLPADERYSFVFDGSAQVLDTAITSSALDLLVREFQFARGNADAAASFLLQAGADIGLRMADHDAYALYVMTDFDGDGVADDQDNCTAVANPSQLDTNADDIGNLCDADVTGPGGDNAEDCFVNFLDLQRVKDAFFSNPASPSWDPEVDLDGSNLINFNDLQIVKNQFFGPPGPSAAGCN